MNHAELSKVVELVAASAKVLSKQSRGLLAEVAEYQRDRDRAVSESALARAELAELQQQIDAAEQETLEDLRDEIASLKDEHKEDEKELEARDYRIAELLDLVTDLAELAHVVDPNAVEHALYAARREDDPVCFGDVAARLRVGAQVRQAALPLGKAANR